MDVTAVSPVQLDYLIAASQSKTWAEAADGLGVTPSAFSQGLGQLERRLGLTLFEPRGRQRTLTPVGLEAVDKAKRVLREHRELASWAASVREGSSGLVRAGMIDTAAVHHFASPLLDFRRSHPEVDLKLEVNSSAELAERLDDGLLDLVVLVDDSLDSADLATTSATVELLRGEYYETPLLTEQLHAYAPPDTSAGRPSQWGPWVTFPASSRTRRHIGRALRRMGSEFDVVAESSQPAVLREMVQLGMGWTVLAPTDAEREPHALRRVSVEPVAYRRLMLKRRAGHDATPPVLRLCEALIESAATNGVVT